MSPEPILLLQSLLLQGGLSSFVSFHLSSSGLDLHPGINLPSVLPLPGVVTLERGATGAHSAGALQVC